MAHPYTDITECRSVWLYYFISYSYFVHKNVPSTQVNNCSKLHWICNTSDPDNGLYSSCHSYIHKH